MHTQDVLITGTGLVVGNRTSPWALFQSVANKQSLVRWDAGCAAAGLPQPAAAHVDEGTLAMLREQLPVQHRDLGKVATMACFAAAQAWRESGLPTRVDELRGGIFAACNKIPISSEQLLAMVAAFDCDNEQIDLDACQAHPAFAAAQSHHRLQDAPARLLAEHYGLFHVLHTYGDACAASGMALGQAYRMIRHGELDVALVGGAEALCTYSSLIAFGAIGALAMPQALPEAQISRPFDSQRCGFVMGEGSAFLVLESRAFAERRQARALAQIGGFAGCAEAFRMTSSNQDGSEYARAMLAAIRDAGLTPEEIDHINAHGTATPANDACEAAAIRRVFAARSNTLPVTANKSATGHSLAGGAAIEAILTALCLQQQCILPTLNFHHAAEDTAGLDVVTSLRPARLRNVLSNSFGFAGENCALVLQAA
jgi:3-oxoacyl-[acyl-carrier-protein] synthase II